MNIMTLDYNGTRCTITNQDIQKRIWKFIQDQREPKPQVKVVRKYSSKKWSQEDNYHLLEMEASGATVEQMSEALNRTHAGIISRLYVLHQGNYSTKQQKIVEEISL